MKTLDIKEGKYYLDNKQNIWFAGDNGAFSATKRVDREFAYPIRTLGENNTLRGSPPYVLVSEYIKNPWKNDSAYYSNFEFIRGLKVGDILRNRVDGSLWAVKKVVLIELAFIHLVAIKGGDCPQRVVHCTCSELGFLELVNSENCIGYSVDSEYRSLIEEYVAILASDDRIEKFHKYIAVNSSGGFNTFIREPTYNQQTGMWGTEDGMQKYILSEPSYGHLAKTSKIKISDIKFTAELIKQNTPNTNVFEFGLDDGSHLKITIERVSSANN